MARAGRKDRGLLSKSDSTCRCGLSDSIMKAVNGGSVVPKQDEGTRVLREGQVGTEGGRFFPERY